MRTTLKDIARATELSVATVSLVLNNKPHQISHKTRERVKQVAKEMSYVPNQLARGLANKQNRMIAFLCEGSTPFYFTYLFNIIQKEALKRGYSVLPYYIKSADEREQVVNLIYQQGVQGVALLTKASSGASELVQYIKERHIECILLDEENNNIDVDSVIASSEYGIYLATTYLLERGHTKIGCVTGEGDIGINREGVKGYYKALEAHGQVVDINCIYQGKNDIGSGEKGAKKLIDYGVSAIIIFEHAAICGVYNYAMKQNIDIPNDLSVIAYDNVTPADTFMVPVTIVGLPLEEIAKQTVIRLIQQMGPDKEKCCRTYRYISMLVERESVGYKKNNKGT